MKRKNIEENWLEFPENDNSEGRENATILKVMVSIIIIIIIINQV
jgi:hypothetical protein